MSTLTDRTIATLRTNHNDLAALVTKFDDDDLTRQSGSSEWDVATVLSHLGSGAEITLAGLQSGISGTEPPGPDFNPSVWDRWNAMSRRDQADGFLVANERLVSTFEGLDETARAEVKVNLAFLPFPADLALISGMRMNEAVLHAWDVKVAFDPRATLTDEEAANTLAQLSGPLSFLLGFTGKADRLGAPSAVIHVTTTRPDSDLGMSITDKVTLTEPPADPDTTLTGPADAIVRLLAGRLGPAYTPDTLTVTGPVSLDQLRNVFPGN